MVYPPLTVVDENDVVVGQELLSTIHQKGLIYRIVLVAVIDESGRILLQHRSSEVKFYPGMWDISAAGHVDNDEGYVTSAERELFEEIGVTGFKLEQVEHYRNDIDYDGQLLKRFATLFMVKVPADYNFVVEESELSEVRWFTQEEIARMLDDPTQPIVQDLRQTLERLNR